MDIQKAQKVWQALQQFYKFKASLLPEFATRNKRNINSMEAQLLKEYERLMQ